MHDTRLGPPFRRATPDDAHALAELIDFAGEGMPSYLWAGMVEPGEGVWDVGRRRACREESGFSYRNAIVAEEDGHVVACLIGYSLPNEPEPIDHDRMPAMFVPLQELENLAPGTWYVNVLADLPRAQGPGPWDEAPEAGGGAGDRLGQQRAEHHRLGRQPGRATAVREVRLPRGRRARDGQGGMGERGRELAPPGQVAAGRGGGQSGVTRPERRLAGRPASVAKA